MTTFALDHVKPGVPLKTRSLGDQFAGSLCAGGDLDVQVVDADTDRSRVVEGVHPLIGAVSLAYAEHLPLVLTPDAIWLTIAQGVAEHIRRNAERLRSLLVRHRGEKTIRAFRLAEPTSPAEWASVVETFRAGLAKEVGEGRARLFECNFSTSTATDLLVSQIVLLGAYKPYFRYQLSFICGIPSITLLGTPADWRAIRERIDVIEELDLAPWCSRLRPILDEMIRTAENKPSLAMWKRIYHENDESCGDYVTGWITHLYPYIGRGMRRPNPVLHPPLRRQIGTKLGLMREEPLGPELFPNELTQAPIDIVDEERSRCVMLHAGLVAIAVEDGGALRPISGWHLAETEPMFDIERKIRELPEARVLAVDEKLSSFDRGMRGIPDDLDELWTRVGVPILFGGAWRFRRPSELLRIAPNARRELMDAWSGLAVADLPNAKHLCSFRRGSIYRWSICTLDETKTRVADEEIVSYGASLATILATALANDGDISSLAAEVLDAGGPDDDHS